MPNIISLDKSYVRVESACVRERIRNRSWSNAKDREYIDDLLVLEKLVKRGPSCFADSLMYAYLKRKYSEDYIGIKAEFKPDELEAELRSEEAARARLLRESEIRKQETHERDIRLRKEWLDLGGKE